MALFGRVEVIALLSVTGFPIAASRHWPQRIESSRSTYRRSRPNTGTRAHLYPLKGWPDAPELETLALRLERHYALDLRELWRENLTLGELFSRIDNARTGNRNEGSFQSCSVGNVAPCSHPRTCRLPRGADCAAPEVMALTRTASDIPRPFRATGILVTILSLAFCVHAVGQTTPEQRAETLRKEARIFGTEPRRGYRSLRRKRPLAPRMCLYGLLR